MRKILLIVSVFHVMMQAHAQVSLPVYPDSLFSTYYHQRWLLFRTLPKTNGDIIFIGNSITDGGEWSEIFNDLRIKNRGISGDISAGVIKRIDEVAKRKPAKVFLMIGTNDLARGISQDSVVKNILLTVAYLKQESPSTKLFVQSILPVNDVFGKFGGHTIKAQQIKQLNKELVKHAGKSGYIFVDLYKSFSDEKGKLKKEFTNDGLHLTGEGYLFWKHLVFPDVFGDSGNPALLPAPQQLKWNEQYFPLFKCRYIVVADKVLQNEAKKLKEIYAEKGLFLSVEKSAATQFIELRLGKMTGLTDNDEAYKLTVTSEKILLEANTPKGIFYAIQTLKQLMRDNVYINGCEITDWPAFPWRGYMVDVGRNYQSLKQLKEQIDVMAAYKLNIFHFHFTEDIAWRLQSKQYPQLTDPQHMLRNAGEYYLLDEMKELIAYCRERYITLVPEIEMPGHSAAFKRALKTDMQSDSGLVIVKNIIKEFCTTYDVPYIHIGADEVKITNKNFIPEITAYIEGFGKKVIDWQPGGNFYDNTVRQLWMDDHAHLSGNKNVKYIDSRHLYLNHMDPLESVVTIFNRKICDKEKGDSFAIGATLCMWNDRAIANENDILKMNPVYPGMLAFAERSWRGGGKTGWIANINDSDREAFAEFENRLLENKNLYFSGKSFNYTKQSNLVWKLFGPYDNSGDVMKKFLPESKDWNEVETKLYKEVSCGTVVLRHWWAPLIKGIIDEPKENTTWYATAKIWSNEDGTKDFWIGFNNFSRSLATDPPPEGAWDSKGSTVCVNGRIVDPPQWKRAGQNGNSKIPLIDEGYEYREPTKIFLQRGWNRVLIKAPVGSFKGKDWQNPVKWMFTFVQIAE